MARTSPSVDSARMSKKHFVFACVSLAFCLAAFEAKRYFALWPFEMKGAPLVLGITGIVIVFSVVILFLSRKKDFHIRDHPWIFLVLVVLQSIGVLGQYLYSQGSTHLLGNYTIFTTLTEMSYLMLFFAIDLFLSFPIKKTIQGFALGFIGAGVIQIVVGLFVSPVTYIVAFMLAPFAWLFYFISLRYGRRVDHSQSPPADAPIKQKPTKQFLILLYCAIFFVCIVFIGIHANITLLQDGGMQSLLIQLSSGLGALLGGVTIYLFREKLKRHTVIEVCCILMFPLALAGLYLSVLFGISGYAAFVLVNYAYVINLLLVWIIPHIYGSSFPATFLGYLGLLIKKLGWGVGLLIMMNVPVKDHEFLNTLFMLLLFVVLTGLVLAIFLQGSLRSRNDGDRQTVIQEDHRQVAYDRLVDQYALTRREKEVFEMLAQGRTAPHIAKKLHVTEGTARTHIAHIYRKMDINSQQSLLDKVDEAIGTSGELA